MNRYRRLLTSGICNIPILQTQKMPPLLAFLKKKKEIEMTPARFEESIVEILRNAENVAPEYDNEVYVDCEISKDALILAKSSDQQGSATSYRNIILRRPPFCPIKLLEDDKCLEDIPQEIKSRGVAVGVAMLLESTDHKVFLTRRAATMRTFPHVWVPPGGHVDQGEGIFQAGVRELKEETGIQIKRDDSMSILGLWESSFPPMKHLGSPRRHHIVVYVHLKIPDTAANISKKICLDRNEVDACTWVCSCVASEIVGTDEQFAERDSSRRSLLERCHSESKMCVKQNDFIDGILFDENGDQLSGTVISTTPLFSNVGNETDNERVSTGTKFALKLWLNSINKEAVNF